MEQSHWRERERECGQACAAPGEDSRALGRLCWLSEPLGDLRCFLMDGVEPSC